MSTTAYGEEEPKSIVFLHKFLLSSMGRTLLPDDLLLVSFEELLSKENSEMLSTSTIDIKSYKQRIVDNIEG